MTIAIGTSEQLNWSPAFRLAVRGFAELVADANQPAELTLSYDDATIFACDEDQTPIGVIVWRKLSYASDAFIVLGYVVPEARGRGVYKALYAVLVATAREAGLRSVSGATTWSNTAMRKIAEKQGRKPVTITYSQVL